MDQFNYLLSKRLKQKGLSEAVFSAYILYKLKDVSSDYRPQKYRQGALYCQIINLDKKMELKLHSGQVQAKLNAALGQNLIKKIVWQMPKYK